MIDLSLRHGADDGKVVGAMSNARQVLAELNSRRAGGDGPEGAANLHRSIRLGVEGVDMARGTSQVDEQDRACPAHLCQGRCGATVKQRREAEAQEAGVPHLEHLAAGQPRRMMRSDLRKTHGSPSGGSAVPSEPRVLTLHSGTRNRQPRDCRSRTGLIQTTSLEPLLDAAAVAAL